MLIDIDSRRHNLVVPLAMVGPELIIIANNAMLVLFICMHTLVHISIKVAP